MRLDYDPATGQFTHRWLHPDHFSGNNLPSRDANRHNTLLAGRLAGGMVNGRMFISVMGVEYPASILAMIMTGNYVHGLEVDHINGNPADNRLQNLRMVTRKQNQANADKPPRVEWEPSRRRWRARAGVGGRVVSLGRYKTKGEAMSAGAKHSRFSFQPNAWCQDRRSGRTRKTFR